MGKYYPVIRTAECGSLNRAAQALGYTQPSLAYIINNIESELGGKIFHRDRQGVTLTENGVRMLETMRQIEVLEARLQREATLGREEVLRVGMLPSVASQWMPEVLMEFYQQYPDAAVKLEHLRYYREGELGVREHRLDCSFYIGREPPGLESIPLYEDPYYLVVSRDSELANRTEVSVQEVKGKYCFIPNNESYDSESAIWEVYQSFHKRNRMESQSYENQMAVGLVERNLGVTLLAGMALREAISDRWVKAIPLKENLNRTICLICPREVEPSSLMGGFLRIVQQTVENWEEQ